MTNDELRLGVDIGRVIIDGSSHPRGGDTAFLNGSTDDVLATPAMAGAFDSISRLTKVFQGRVWLISKCGARVQARTELWLAHVRFFETTGIDATHLRFCLQRSDKAVHCQELGITHFVDDRTDVLKHLVGIVSHLFLFGPQKQPIPPYVISSPRWEEAEHRILERVQGGTIASNAHSISLDG
jgi:hypothetical protein